MILKVLTFPDPFLKTQAKRIESIDDQVKQLADSMAETMYERQGLGLAAVQVGYDMRMFVMDVGYDIQDGSTRNPLVLINPEIIAKHGSCFGEEGCLSVPEFRAEIERAQQIRIRYTSLDGCQQKLRAEGLMAVCVQHEMDHLDGKLFIDYLPPLKRKMIQTRLKKLAIRTKND